MLTSTSPPRSFMSPSTRSLPCATATSHSAGLAVISTLPRDDRKEEVFIFASSPDHVKRRTLVTLSGVLIFSRKCLLHSPPDVTATSKLPGAKPRVLYSLSSAASGDAEVLDRIASFLLDALRCATHSTAPGRGFAPSCRTPY